jgi:hypothetical protein
MTPGYYSTPALLEWSRQAAPDLHISHDVVSGARVVVATFTVEGEPHTLAATDRDAIAVLVAESLRTASGFPPLGAPDRQTELEQRIVMASLGGDVASCESLTRQLVMGRSAVPLGRATSFGKAVVE